MTTPLWNCGCRGARAGVALLILGTTPSCARLHHVNVSDIDSTRGELRPFEVQVSSTGFSVRDGAAVARVAAGSAQARRNVNTAETIIALTQMGPKTGDPTFEDDWADALAHEVLARCPSGRLTGLSVRRESMDYPVISGEIVTVRGYCVL